jgi:hypothetical protein
MRQDVEALRLQTTFDPANRETVELEATLDIPVRAIASPRFFKHRLGQMEHAIITAYALTPHGRGEIRRREKQYDAKGDVIDLPDLDFVVEMG